MINWSHFCMSELHKDGVCSSWNPIFNKHKWKFWVQRLTLQKHIWSTVFLSDLAKWGRDFFGRCSLNSIVRSREQGTCIYSTWPPMDQHCHCLWAAFQLSINELLKPFANPVFRGNEAFINSRFNLLNMTTKAGGIFPHSFKVLLHTSEVTLLCFLHQLMIQIVSYVI